MQFVHNNQTNPVCTLIRAQHTLDDGLTDFLLLDEEIDQQVRLLNGRDVDAWAFSSLNRWALPAVVRIDLHHESWRVRRSGIGVKPSPSSSANGANPAAFSSTIATYGRMKIDDLRAIAAFNIRICNVSHRINAWIYALNLGDECLPAACWKRVDEVPPALCQGQALLLPVVRLLHLPMLPEQLPDLQRVRGEETKTRCVMSDNNKRPTFGSIGLGSGRGSSV